MHKIKLITDTTSDLSPDLIEAHQITMVPLYVNFKEETYRDLFELNPKNMYDLVQKKGFLPKTAAASPGDFYNVFKEYLAEGYEIIYTGIGGNFSASLTSANTAKKMLDSTKIHLVDSQNLSSGSGLLVLKAAKFRSEGDSAEMIVKKLEAIRSRVRSQFVIDTLEYLYKGGRLNALSAFMGTMLRIKPIIKVHNGLMAVGKKPRGNIRIGIDLMIRELLELEDRVDEDFLMITHSLADEQAVYIKQELAKHNLKIKHIYETAAGCVISSHCGKGTIGILYIEKE
ncbi:MAG: DegV family protein [Candidatus Izemoplasmatales bacterium]|jgi:DegV family protein with EDD domain|nr:DegV family protein [Candidatus Izemoplasmatales bacterium]NLF48510.1 DegV family protein [Acholeplasmataceae bacterium]MDD4354297.1 DegV family protein [Candidatus Izemoplasmatales bacterium]MDD4987301.1 DegV family protein [Candidatus Izemoplasmatales bacterium]MDD5601331.1 DegV family protein [Candidatus Izemoplasmatales bacterium]